MKIKLTITEEVKMCGPAEFKAVLADMRQELKAEGLLNFIKTNISDDAEVVMGTAWR
jgi:hypothetical protein